jgi:uncharacterized protein with beta-barrel porin domain
MRSVLSSRLDKALRRLGVVLLAGIALTCAGTPAAADCTTSGNTVTCSSTGGDQTTTIGTGVEDQVTVNVLPGATIAVGPDTVGVLLQSQNAVTNSGVISSGDATFLFSGGVLFFGDDNVVINNGSIAVGNAAGGQAAGIRSFGVNLSVTNNNSIVVGNGSGTTSYAFDASGVVLGNNSRITNNGSIVTGNFSQGIFACCGNTIINSAGALIQAGNDSVAVFSGGSSNTVSNAGEIVVGNGTAPISFAYAILLSGDNSSATNTGTIRTGNLAVGMAIDDPAGGGATLTGNTLINGAGGTIIGGNGSYGMASGSQFIYPPDATLINNGTIIIGNSIAGVSPAIGMVGFGPAALTNRGSITVGDGTGGTQTFGLYVGEAGSSVVNAGSVVAGLFGIGIRAAGDGTTVNNSGTITVGAGGIGIEARLPFFGANATGPAITNSGTIIARAGATGVMFGDNGTLINSGSIQAIGDGTGTTGYSIFACACTTATITNLGILDGKIQAQGTVTTFVNNGLITITDSHAVQPIGPFNFNISDVGGGGGSSFTQTAAGTLSLRVMPGAPAPIDSLLGDTVTLAGTLRVAIQPGLYTNTTTTDTAVSLTNNGAANITTTFDSFVSSSPFFTVTPIYDTGNSANYTSLTLQLDRQALGSVAGMTPNQRAVGNVLEPGYSTGLTGDLATFYGNLLSATSLTVLDQLSGAGTAAAQDGAFAAGSQFGNAMFQQMQGWLSGTPGGNTFTFGTPLGYASAPKNKLASKPGSDAFAAMEPRDNTGRWSAWTSGFGSARSVDGEFGTANQTSTTVGGAFGVDRQLTPDFLLGFAVGGSGSNFSVSSLTTSGRINAGHAGVYAIQRMGTSYIAATMNYARGETSTDRTITGVGPTENAKGKFASDQLSGRIELGRKYGFRGYSVTPFVAIEPAALWQHAYTENSTTLGGAPGMLGLSYQSNTVTSLPLFLGAQIDATYSLAGGQTLSPFARLSWVHEFKPERRIQASFVSIPGGAFTVDGARATADAFRMETGGTLSFNNRAALFLNVTSEFSSRSHSIAALGGARMNW